MASTLNKIVLFALLTAFSVHAAPTDGTTTTTTTTTTVVSKGPAEPAMVPGINHWGHLGLTEAPRLEPFSVSNKIASATLSVDIQKGIIVAQDLKAQDDADKKEEADLEKQEKALVDKENALKADEKKTKTKEVAAKKHVAGLIDHFKAQKNIQVNHLIIPSIKDKTTTTVVKKILQKGPADKAGKSTAVAQEKGAPTTTSTENSSKDHKTDSTTTKSDTHSVTITKDMEEFKEIMTTTTMGHIAGKLGNPESILISTVKTEDKKVNADGSYTLSFSYVKVTKIAEVVKSPDSKASTLSKDTKGTPSTFLTKTMASTSAAPKAT